MRNLRPNSFESSALLKVQILYGAPRFFIFFYTFIAHRSTNTCTQYILFRPMKNTNLGLFGYVTVIIRPFI